ncbi:hypothetical protein AB3X91_34305 [Paraburkholderia sp. BR14263]|uniref:antitoxin PaaA2 family protein n=1 Tax=unclassified Paraburkholderia TaxID=2615204 RepID=UPI0034CD3195
MNVGRTQGSAPRGAYDTWFREQVQEALDDPRPNVPHAQVQREMSGKKAEQRNQLARRR